jgi:excisionase family DNA binding protein
MNETTQKPLDITQASEFLHLKKSYVYQLVFLGRIRAFKPGGKKLLFKLSDLEEYAYRNQKGGNSERADAILNAPKKPRRKSQGEKVKA